MDEWNALEDAIRRKSWPEASGKARAFLDAWNESRHAVLLFASEEVEAGATRFEGVLSKLVALLECQPVDADAVEDVKVQVRAFFSPEESP